ncbi:Calcineurin-like phosphoesterase superfamily domain protein [Anatilimnocola aggregata]|uniref:Calcineurin-like phosphoesterase superfamily domain protein n=1 Tax=Anatilimnocola aggregata TaxID=2528021 RepID=A0A517YEH5_9BACT|nr:metallophosphoesterase [Anatilimnocola aggregata]QDU28636.1 Calcineurin-like phosphoesterase superfamily domain protein [Anatilimnocola aggregata]
MKLGLITDIHEQVDDLRVALARFKQERVDQIVMIGDVIELGERLDETCRLLLESKAIGVWGNHDYGLCVDPPQELQRKYSRDVFEFMGKLRPSLEIEGCYFSHVEPWLNPESLFDLWYYDGPPDEHGKLWRIFHAVPNRLMFAGHFHKWLLASPDQIHDWHGEKAVKLDQGRYFVVIGAVCDGCFATFDTVTSELVPLSSR